MSVLANRGIRFLKRAVREELEGKDLRGTILTYKVFDFLELEGIDLSGCVFYRCILKNIPKDSTPIEISDLKSIAQFNNEMNTEIKKEPDLNVLNYLPKNTMYYIFDYIHLNNRYADPNRIKTKLHKMDFASFKSFYVQTWECENSSFQNCNFKDAHLIYVDFKRSSLKNSSFKDAKLDECSFKNCDLTNTNFDGCSIHKGSFMSSSLIDVDLSSIAISIDDVNVKNMLFTDESMREELEEKGAIWLGKGMNIDQRKLARIGGFPNLEIKNKDLSNSLLSRLSINNCVFKNINFEGTVFKDCYFANISPLLFENCNFRNCEFQFCKISCDFFDCDFEGTEFLQCDGINVFFKNSSLKDTTFFESEMEFYFTDLYNTSRERLESHWGVFLGPNTKLGGVRLKGKDLSGINFEGSVFTHSNYRSGPRFKNTFNRANLENTNFKNTTIVQGSFENANLKNANFKGANLNDINFRSADLRGANFEGVLLKNVRYDELTKFEGANISKEQLDSMNFASRFRIE